MQIGFFIFNISILCRSWNGNSWGWPFSGGVFAGKSENGTVYPENGTVTQENGTVYPENGTVTQENGTKWHSSWNKMALIIRPVSANKRLLNNHVTEFSALHSAWNEMAPMPEQNGTHAAVGWQNGMREQRIRSDYIIRNNDICLDACWPCRMERNGTHAETKWQLLHNGR
ncbi:MAG: hypothetical protein HQL87_07755 [Magnetococcales bacterium]|nr:hypothetical protein [Magnetococcales bacterium]